MNEVLIQKIQQSTALAQAKGTVLKLRKQRILCNKFISKNHSINYRWYQTPAKVGIQIPYKIENKQDLKVQFEDERVTIDFPREDGGKYHLNLELFMPIVPARSKTVHYLDKIQIVMEKRDSSQNWFFLRKDGLGIPEGKELDQNLYPSSAKVKKNWDKIDREIEKDIKNHCQEYGEDTGMNFFKQIFANGDEEKRRAMWKSFTTSGGTVLSTDWNDVAKKDYEGKDRPSPPKGQEWKKPEI